MQEPIMETTHGPEDISGKLADIPRKLSYPLQIANLFGFKSSKMGWSFFTLSILLGLLLLSLVDYQNFFFGFKTTAFTKAKIEKTKKTLWQGKGEKLYKYFYTFEDEKGRIFAGKSYDLQSKFSLPDAQVKYVKANPKISVVVGMRGGVFSASLLLFPLFLALMGLITALSGYQKGRSANLLLKYGRIALADLKEQKQTGKFFKGTEIYKLVFEYINIDGKPKKIILKTHRTDKLSPDKKEPVFYDPLKYHKALIPIAVPCGVVIEPEKLTCENPVKKLTCLLFPLSSLVAFLMVLYLCIRYQI